MATISWSTERERLLGNADEAGFILPPHIKMPVMPTAITEFSRKADEPDVSPGELASIVESDSGLTCEVLKYVNSSAFGLRMEIASVKHAITTLGMKQVQLFLMTSGVKKALSSRQSKLVNLENFWIANLERALFAREIARLLGADENVSFAAAMLQDVLLPILSNEECDAYLSFMNEQDRSPKLITNFERERYRWDHASAGAHVLNGWNFPDEIVCCVYLHHSGIRIMTDERMRRTSVAATALAALIPDAIRQVPDGLKRIQQLDQIWASFDLLQVAETVNEQFTEMAPGLANHFPLLKRVEKMLATA